MKKLFKKITITDFVTFFICICFLTIASLPLFHAGLFPTIDNITVVRTDEMAKELHNGQFPVRHVANLAHGHGYMLFNFYAPFPFYISASLHNLVGTNLTGAVKRTFFLALIVATVSMFIFSKKFFGNIGAMVSTVLYVFSPYLGFDVYTRGGLGEVWAYALLPLVFWAFYMVLEKKRLPYILIASASLALVVISHNLTAYIVIPFLIVWILFFLKKYAVWQVMIYLGLSMGLCAFFWIPVITEKSLVWVTYSERSFFDFQRDLIASLKDFIFPYPPAKINFLYILAPIGALLVSRKYKLIDKKVVYIAFLFFILSFLMNLSISYFVWKNFYSYVYILQFPWRLLVIVTLFSSFLSGYLFVKLPKHIAFPFALLMITVVFFFSIKNFRPVRYDFIDRYKAEDPCGTTYGQEYLPIWVKRCFTESSNIPVEISSGNGIVSAMTSRPGFYQATVNTSTTSLLRISEYYYPGWKVKVDNKPVKIYYDNPYGMIEIPFSSGKHTVVAVFQDELLRRISNLISLISIFLFSLFIFFSIAKKLVKPMAYYNKALVRHFFKQR